MERGTALTRLNCSLTILLWIIALGIAAVSCANEAVNDHGGEKEVSVKTIEQGLREHTNQLMSIPGVVGTGQGLCNDKPCIKVFVVKKTPDLDREILKILESYPVKIEETGRIRAR